MNDLRTAAQQALEALEKSNRFVWHYAMSKDTTRKAQACDAAITALRAALAQGQADDWTVCHHCGQTMPPVPLRQGDV